jgi:hypothetical protein
MVNHKKCAALLKANLCNNVKLLDDPAPVTVTGEKSPCDRTLHHQHKLDYSCVTKSLYVAACCSAWTSRLIDKAQINEYRRW